NQVGRILLKEIYEALYKLLHLLWIRLLGSIVYRRSQHGRVKVPSTTHPTKRALNRALFSFAVCGNIYQPSTSTPAGIALGGRLAPPLVRRTDFVVSSLHGLER